MHKDLLVLVHCLSSFHPGSGASVSHVDLPVQREAGTGLPMMQGSGFKGALRHKAEGMWGRGDEKVKTIFGPEPDAAHEHAGAARFTDLRLLLFPVKSLRGIFAWITSPKVLGRFRRDLTSFGFKLPFEVPEVEEDKVALVSSETNLLLEDRFLMLEEFTFSPQRDEAPARVGAWLAEKIFPEDDHFQTHLSRNLVIVSDMVFSSFTEFSMEVVTRIRINPETGTVEEGALWNEENLPAESVLYGFVMAEDVRRENGGPVAEEIASWLKELQGVCQFGGNATVGRGLVRLSFHEA